MTLATFFAYFDNATNVNQTKLNNNMKSFLNALRISSGIALPSSEIEFLYKQINIVTLYKLIHLMEVY